jgi:hypothetical protein
MALLAALPSKEVMRHMSAGLILQPGELGEPLLVLVQHGKAIITLRGAWAFFEKVLALNAVASVFQRKLGIEEKHSIESRDKLDTRECSWTPGSVSRVYSCAVAPTCSLVTA